MACSNHNKLYAVSPTLVAMCTVLSHKELDEPATCTTLVQLKGFCEHIWRMSLRSNTSIAVRDVYQILAQ